ncbi:nucleotide sugar dehydrogenase [Natronomonas gomsonensis]|uniref:nucleotide sugar dehydrogenase n=1 Tax=Natronomonas gomsonensis TaxID=1046043 RepID=UPI0015B7E468|nr:nucleotide sugar dehydrogenase [Natronomonas gomsonensis]
MSSVCVHGLGYIGLPTAAMLANYDHDVYGYDASKEVTEQLRGGEVHLDEPGLRAFVTQALESGQLNIVEEVVEAKYHVICVPTPFDEESKEADLNYVRQAGKAVGPHLRSGDTVILESTVPPGTTFNELKPVLEESGLAAGKDFALVHCPETVLPGNIITELRQNNRIIGGVNGVSTEAAVRLYRSFVEGDIRTTEDATTAEFVKLIQNTFRDTNIALANEIAKLAADYDIDSREAIEMANTHPRVEIHQPGPGVGGHCLPIDPWFLGYGSDQLDLIETAREINDGMACHIVDILREELGTLDGRQIALLGVAYKGNVGDVRQSPALDLAAELQQAAADQSQLTADGGNQLGGDGVDIRMHDPHVDDQVLDLVGFDEAVTGADAVVITTDHDEFAELEPAPVLNSMTGDLLVDTKAILPEREWISEGFSLRRI